MSYIDLAGMVFGKWTVVKRTARKKTVYYLCKCSCGTKREVLSVSLRNGRSISCGCAQPEKWSKGIRRANRNTYTSWSGMKQRCNYKKHIGYHRYGGRGITYDPRWNDFSTFLYDMGAKPVGMSLDRINNDGPYCVENCRWVTKEEQSSNTSRNIIVTWEGEYMTLKRLSAKLSIEYDLVHKWHRTKGLSLKDAVARALERVPVGSNKPYAPTDLSETVLVRT